MENTNPTEDTHGREAIGEENDATETGDNPEHGGRDGGDTDAAADAVYDGTKKETEEGYDEEKAAQWLSDFPPEEGFVPPCVDVKA